MSSGAHGVLTDPIKVKFLHYPDLKKPLEFLPVLLVPCPVAFIPCHDRDSTREDCCHSPETRFPKLKSLQELERIADANESDVQKVNRDVHVRVVCFCHRVIAKNYCSWICKNSYLRQCRSLETWFALDRALRDGRLVPGCENLMFDPSVPYVVQYLKTEETRRSIFGSIMSTKSGVSSGTPTQPISGGSVEDKVRVCVETGMRALCDHV